VDYEYAKADSRKNFVAQLRLQLNLYAEIDDKIVVY
jgi:hypothetical protein